MQDTPSSALYSCYTHVNVKPSSTLNACSNDFIHRHTEHMTLQKHENPLWYCCEGWGWCSCNWWREVWWCTKISFLAINKGPMLPLACILYLCISLKVWVWDPKSVSISLTLPGLSPELHECHSVYHYIIFQSLQFLMLQSPVLLLSSTTLHQRHYCPLTVPGKQYQ